MNNLNPSSHNLAARPLRALPEWLGAAPRCDAGCAVIIPPPPRLGSELNRCQHGANSQRTFAWPHRTGQAQEGRNEENGLSSRSGTLRGRGSVVSVRHDGTTWKCMPVLCDLFPPRTANGGVNTPSNASHAAVPRYRHAPATCSSSEDGINKFACNSVACESPATRTPFGPPSSQFCREHIAPDSSREHLRDFRVRMTALWLAGFALLLGMATPARAANDYPYPNESTVNVDPWNFYYRQCTSFIAWRMNRDAGRTTAPYYFLNLMHGGRWGNAENWSANATALGFVVNSTPAVGAIAHWNASEIPPLGHVAYVEQINGDGSVNVSEYNFASALNYGTRNNVRPPRFIHLRKFVNADRVRANSNVNVRSSPGGAQVTLQTAGALGTITAGPANQI